MASSPTPSPTDSIAADGGSQSQAPTSAPTPVPANAVKLEMTAANVNYNDLIANVEVKNEFISKAKMEISAKAGAAILADHIDIELRAGSVVVEATITPPVGTTMIAVQTALSNDANAMAQNFAAEVASIPNIAGVSSGPITVKVTSSPSVTVATPTPTPATGFETESDDALALTPSLLLVASIIHLLG